MVREAHPVRRKAVLDKGFVEIVDCMGSDQRVIDAARVSTGSQAQSDRERDKQLINFLMEHRHETPFEKIVFEFHVKCPIFVARQWARHRIGSFNERSARYRVFELDYYVPSLEDMPEGYTAEDIQQYVNCLKGAYEVYERMLAKVADQRERRARAREVFRGLLGTAYYTEFFWTVNFRSLMNFLRLRLSEEAQIEMRRYAQAINEMIPPLIPWSYEAFATHVLGRAAGRKKRNT